MPEDTRAECSLADSLPAGCLADSLAEAVGSPAGVVESPENREVEETAPCYNE